MLIPLTQVRLYVVAALSGSDRITIAVFPPCRATLATARPDETAGPYQRRLNKSPTQLASSANAFWNSQTERVGSGQPTWVGPLDILYLGLPELTG